MRPLLVVVGQIFLVEMIQVLASKNDKLVQAFLLDRLNEPLNVRVPADSPRFLRIGFRSFCESGERKSIQNGLIFDGFELSQPPG